MSRKSRLLKKRSTVHTQMKIKILNGEIKQIDSATLRRFMDGDADFKKQVDANFEIFPQIQGYSWLIKKKGKV